MPAPVQLSRLPASLIAILALAGALRLLGITSPLLDNHRWRQVDTAAIARNLYRGDMNILYPEIDWGGHAGYVECEFPLVPFIVAIGYQIFGVHEWFGRFVSLAFSLGTVATLYRFGTLTLGAPAGRAAAFLFAISPSAVYYGRTFMPDAAMVFFSAAAVLASIEYHRHGRRRDLISMAICLPLACLVKLPAVIVIPVIFAAAFEHRGKAAFREKATAVAVLVALAATAAWYAHAAHRY
jgi:Gpi18-like mannosyltransferase